MREETSDIGAVRLGVLALGVIVFGLSLGAFVSYLDAGQTHRDARDSTNSGEQENKRSVDEQSRDQNDETAILGEANLGIDEVGADWANLGASMMAASHAKSIGEDVAATADEDLEASPGEPMPSDVEQESDGDSDGVTASNAVEVSAVRTVGEDPKNGAMVGKSELGDRRRGIHAEQAPVPDPGTFDRQQEDAEATKGNGTGVVLAGARGGRAGTRSGRHIGADGDDKSGASGGADTEETSGEDSKGEFTAENVARRIQKFYRNTEDFKSNFKQVYHDIAAGEKKIRWGKVYFKTPGKMRWDYYKSEELKDRTKTLVSDGDFLWIYELEFQQVFKECLSEKQLPTSLKFLMGEGNLLDDFNVSFTDASTRESPELELVPKEPTPKYKKLHFKVDADAEQVTETTVFDPYGNTNTIHFRDVTLNTNLPDSGFQFEPPEDARLLNKNVSCD